MNFSRSALFHMKTRVCLKNLVHNCIWKVFFAFNSPQASLNLIFQTMLVTLSRLTQFNVKLEQLTMLKSAKIRFP